MIALFAAAVATFAGGSTNDLVKTLREASGQDAVVVRASSNEAPLKSFDFDPSSIDAMNTVFKTNLQLKVVPGAEPLFSDEFIPSSLLRGFQGRAMNVQVQYSADGGTFAPAPPSGRKPLGKDAFQNGRVTFATTGKDTLDVSSLLNAPFGKPLEMSWVYLDLLPSVDFRGATPVAFLQKVARALGAHYRESPKTYYLEFNATEFRRRAAKSLEAMIADAKTPETAGQLARIKLALAVVRSISNDGLTQAFITPGSKTEIGLTANSGLQGAANDYLHALEQAPSDGPVATVQGQGNQGPGRVRGPRGGQGRQIANALQRIDNSRTAVLTFDSQFQCQIEVPILDAQGRPGGSVRF